MSIPQKRMILSCSGASNVGQLSNQAAVELTRDGFGQMFCLAAIGAHLEKFVNYARSVSSMTAIDGCSIGCVRALLEHAGVPLRHYLVLTDLGIEKNMSSTLERADVERVKQAAIQSAARSPVFPMVNPSDGGCCES